MDCEESACFRRESELAELERRCVSRRFEFGVIYGTRRIGKTTMLQEFIIKEKNAFIFRRAKQMKKTISSLSAANISASGERTCMPVTAPHASRAKRATLYKESAMLRKAYTPASMFFEAFTLLVVGILFFTNPEGTLVFVVSIIHILAWITAINNLFHWLTKRDEHRPSLFHALLMLGFAVFLTIHPVFIVSSASLVFAIWILINAIAKYIYAYQLQKTKSRGTMMVLLQGILYSLFALSIFSDPAGGAISLSWLLGLYCLVHAFFALTDAVRELLGTDLDGKRVRQHIRFKPSVLLTALLPMQLLRILDDPNEEAEIQKWTRQETAFENAQPNLEIFLHLGKNVAFGMGHVDIALDGKTYSFGNYDSSSNRLFGAFSDGVFFRAERDPYLNYVLTHQKRRLIGYGVVLSDVQKAAVLDAINEFLYQSKQWYPSAEKTPVPKIMEQEAHAEFFKIGYGPFKTYNVLTTNCVAVANILSGSGGVDLMNPQGIITPGTYSEFLDRQFLRKKSIVVSRTVYR